MVILLAYWKSSEHNECKIKYKNFKFSFPLVTRREVEEAIKLLDTSKSQPFNDIKDNRDIFSNFVTRFFNSGISTSRFPTALKNAEVKPVFTSNIKLYEIFYKCLNILNPYFKIPIWLRKGSQCPTLFTSNGWEMEEILS